MGPVTTESPRAVNRGQALNAASDCFEVEAEGEGAGDGGGIGDGAGGLGVAVDAVGAGAEHGEPLARMILQLEGAEHAQTADCARRRRECGPW